MTAAPKLGALAVLLRGSRVLLARRRNPPDAGLWGFPGGHVELGETALEAAARELREETGVTADPVDYLTNVDVIQRGPGGEVAHHFLLAAVLCRYREGEPAPAEDVSEAAWIEADRVLAGELPASEAVDHVLRLAQRAVS